MLRICLVLTVIFMLGACSDPPKQGVVISTEYNQGHNNEYLYCAGYITTTTNGISYTTCSVWLPAYYWVPDTWSLKLKDGDHTGWRDVPESVYNGPCGHLGADYPECIP